MKVLCIGGAGFIGSHVIDALLDQGHEVFCYDDFSTGKWENIPMKRLHAGQNGSILNDTLLNSCFDDWAPEAVVHLAAQAAISTSYDAPDVDMLVNGIGTLKVIRACLDHGVSRLVYSSTSAVYSDMMSSPMHGIQEIYPIGPNTPYGISKYAAESYVRSLFHFSTVLRFGNVYGPRQVPIGVNQVVARAILHFEKDNPFFIFGHGNQRRDFVYVADVADAVVAALTGELGTYNIATNESHSVNEVAKLVAKCYHMPNYEFEHEGDEDPRKNVHLNAEHAANRLGWRFKVSLAEGIARTVEWWKDHK